MIGIRDYMSRFRDSNQLSNPINTHQRFDTIRDRFVHFDDRHTALDVHR